MDCPDDLCEAAAPFVLIFQRPRDSKPPAGDPDPFLPLAVEETASSLSPVRGKYERPIFIALGQARELIPPRLKASRAPGLEIVLEEWAIQKDERPPLPEGVSLPAVLTDRGDPRLGPDPIDVVFFLDSYHLLFHGNTLLSKLREKLSPGGCIYILDRESTGPLARREASHRRKIEPRVVKREMAAAGFHLWCEGPRPAPDRFLLVFGKTAPAQMNLQTDPLVSGPVIDCPPEVWLRQNLWRLRGLRTEGGRVLPLTPTAAKPVIEKADAVVPGTEAWRLPERRLLLSFRKSDGGHTLAGVRAFD